MARQVVQALSRAVCWTAGLFEGLVAGLAGRRHGRRDEELPLLESDEPLADVRAALIGRHRRQIVRVLGAPPTACVGFGVSVSPVPRDAFWQASTWYYPFDRLERMALAIRFVGDRAREVEFVGAPESRGDYA
jgi:hypothetical protein